jgi:hypothetical protein
MWFVVTLSYKSEAPRLYCPDRYGHYAKKFTLEEATAFAAKINRTEANTVAGVHPADMYDGEDAAKICGGDVHYLGR